MLSGTADPQQLAQAAAEVEDFDPPPLTLPDTTLLQVLFEMRYAERQAVLPPALHPTNPPTLIVQVWHCAESPWGPFDLAQLRIGCRSGVRTRGLVVGAVCDNGAAGRALARGWGFRVLSGAVSLRQRYDGIQLEVVCEQRRVLQLAAVDPEPLAPGDVQYTGTLTLAHTPRGLRLIQVEPHFTLESAERLTPRPLTLDARAWGQPLLTPYHPISASLARGSLALTAPRFVCRPDVLAFEGSEPV